MIFDPSSAENARQRTNQGPQIRFYTIHLSEEEPFCLRLLLHRPAGPQVDDLSRVYDVARLLLLHARQSM